MGSRLSRSPRAFRKGVSGAGKRIPYLAVLLGARLDFLVFRFLSPLLRHCQHPWVRGQGGYEATGTCHLIRGLAPPSASRGFRGANLPPRVLCHVCCRSSVPRSEWWLLSSGGWAGWTSASRISLACLVPWDGQGSGASPSPLWPPERDGPASFGCLLLLLWSPRSAHMCVGTAQGHEP